MTNDAGYYTHGYANEIVILIIDRHTSIISELMQIALNMVEGWCKKENLGVNLAETAPEEGD